MEIIHAYKADLNFRRTTWASSEVKQLENLNFVHRFSFQFDYFQMHVTEKILIQRQLLVKQKGNLLAVLLTMERAVYVIEEIKQYSQEACFSHAKRLAFSRLAWISGTLLHNGSVSSQQTSFLVQQYQQKELIFPVSFWQHPEVLLGIHQLCQAIYLFLK